MEEEEFYFIFQANGKMIESGKKIGEKVPGASLSAIEAQKVAENLYSRSVYVDSDRISAYNDYRAMDQSPEISVALDIMADECVTRNDRGEILTIYSEDARIKRVLNDFFHGTININYNLWFWIRSLLKYGDEILKLEIDFLAAVLIGF